MGGQAASRHWRHPDTYLHLLFRIHFCREGKVVAVAGRRDLMAVHRRIECLLLHGLTFAKRATGWGLRNRHACVTTKETHLVMRLGVSSQRIGPRADRLQIGPAKL